MLLLFPPSLCIVHTLRKVTFDSLRSLHIPCQILILGIKAVCACMIKCKSVGLVMEWREGKGSNSLIETLEIETQNVKIEKQWTREEKITQKIKATDVISDFFSKSTVSTNITFNREWSKCFWVKPVKEHVQVIFHPKIK